MPKVNPKRWADMSTAMLRAHELNWQGPLNGEIIVDSSVVWTSEPAGLVFSNLQLIGSRTLVDVSTPDKAPVDYEVRCTLTDSSGLVHETEPPIELRVNPGGVYNGPFWFGNPLINVGNILIKTLELFPPTVQNAVGADAPLLTLTLNLFAPTPTIVPTPLTIPIAVQFNNADAPVLTKTFAGAAADATRATISVWFRRNFLGEASVRQGMTFLFGGADASNNTALFLDTGDIFAFGEGVITVEHLNGGVLGGGMESKFQLFDNSAWYHLVVAVDSNEAVAVDRFKFWINGRAVTDKVLLATMTQGASFDWLGTDPNSIGQGETDRHDPHQLDSNLAEMHVVDGQALTAASFGSFTDGLWGPVNFPSAAHGANGFHLDFADSSDFGKDTGTGFNHWSSAGLVAGDQILDVPDNVFPVLTPYAGQGRTRLLDGATVMDATDGGRHNALTTTGLTAGQWYWEVEFDEHPDRIFAGVYDYGYGIPEAGPIGFSLNPDIRGGWCLLSDGTFYADENGGSASGLATFVAGDIAMFAYNADNGDLWVGRNGTWVGFPPFFGPIATVVAPNGTQRAVSPWIQVLSTSAGVTTGKAIINFGAKASKPFAHTVPTGYSAISTGTMLDANYAPIPDGSAGNDLVMYTGTGASQSFAGLAFAPDLGWVKERQGVSNHKLVDTTRGDNEHISTNLVDAEVTDANGLALDALGFTVGSASDVNNLNDTYVGWMFKKGPAFGVDIVQYTGNGVAGKTFAHSLGGRPDMVMVKNLDQATDWYMLWMHWLDDVIEGSRFVWEPIANPEQYAVPMAGGNREQTAAYWNNTVPTSSVVTLGNSGAVNGNGDRHIAYLFRSIPGYLRVSARFGMNPWCGFRPRVMLQRRMSFGSGSGNFELLDRSLLEPANGDTMGNLNYFQARAFNTFRSQSYLVNTTNAETIDGGLAFAREYSGGGGGNHAFSFLAFAEFAAKKSRGY